MILNINHIT